MKNLRILIALLSTLILAGSFVSAFVLFNPAVKWDSDDLARNIEINASGHSSVDSVNDDGGVMEIRDAIDASWNAEVAGLTTTQPVPSPPASIGDGTSTMHFNVVGTGCSGGCLAVTITPIPPSTPIETVNGQAFRLMTDSDIFFNPSGKFYSSSEACNREAHIESVAVHEVGHLLGLAHTPVSNATMFATTSLCSENGASLAQDDSDGINCIYNNGYGCGGCVPDTLVVDQTNCDQPTSGPNAGDFVVETFIVDNCGGAVASADVTLDIPISPLGPLTCSGTTSSTGRLGCALDNPPEGLYESLVGGVSKAGFDAWTGSECGGAGDPPCGCSIEIGGGGGCVPTASKEKGPKCSNGLDDDCDGLIDGADPDC